MVLISGRSDAGKLSADAEFTSGRSDTNSWAATTSHTVLVEVASVNWASTVASSSYEACVVEEVNKDFVNKAVLADSLHHVHPLCPEVTKDRGNVDVLTEKTHHH